MRIASSMRHPLLALLRFHSRSTVRVTLRNTGIQAVLLFVAVGLTPEPNYTVMVAAAVVVRGEVGALVVFGLWLWANALAARPALESTLRGWHRHLPLGRDHRRRAVVLAGLACQGPVLAVGWILWVMGVALSDQLPIEGPWRVSGSMPIALLLLGASSTVLAVRWRPRGIGVWTALPAAVLVLGSWWGVGIAAGLLWLHDRWDPSPRSASVRAVPGVRGPIAQSLFSRRISYQLLPGSFLPWRLMWRALGTSTVLSLWLGAAIPIACVWLFIRNNELQVWEATLGARVGGGLALVAMILPLAGGLRKNRPPWAWSRSLPWSSRSRLMIDAGFLALLTLPMLIPIGRMAPWAIPPLSACLLLQAVRAASALYRQEEGMTRLGASTVGEIWLLPLLAAAWPWITWMYLPALAPAIRSGSQWERKLKVSRWRERHHLDLGET